MKVNPRDAAIQLTLAAVRDLGDVERLLQLVDLPIDGLRDQFPEAYVIVPRELALAPEFAGACPASATCLVWRPQPPGPG